MQVRASGVHTNITVGMDNPHGKPCMSQMMVDGGYNLQIEINLMKHNMGGNGNIKCVSETQAL